jgi:hypothetical protein
MLYRIPGLVVIGTALAFAASISIAKEPPRDRRAFAREMGKIKEGMPQAEVIKILGPPDDVTTKKDGEGMEINHALEIWRYGASGHMKPATLAQICIDVDHRVQYISGQGPPPPEGMFAEPELRRILEALSDLPGLNGSFYNPRPVIRAVNLLQPLGKEKALAAIEEYLRVSSWLMDDHPREGVFVVLRTLFEVPSGQTVFPHGIASTPGYMPPMLVGASIPAEPNDKKLLPRFPVAIEGDIPFFLVEGYNLGGRPELPESHVIYFRKFGKLRAKPLSPTAKPIEALQAFENSPRWYFKGKVDGPFEYDRREQILLGNQLMRLLNTVDQVEPNWSGQFLGFDSDEKNQKLLHHASTLAIRWDAKECKYTFLDGTSLVPPDPNRYSLHFWTPKIPGLSIEFSAKRGSRRYVNLGLEETAKLSKPNPRGIVRVFNVKTPQKALCEFKVGEPVSVAQGAPEVHVGATDSQGYSQSTGTTVEIEEGQKIRAVLVIGEKSFESPVFEP